MKTALILSILIASSISCAHKADYKKSSLRKVAQETVASFTPLLSEDSDSVSLDSTSLVGIHNNADTTPLVDLINMASKSIDIEIYEMYDKAFVGALGKALERGVRLRLIKDPQPVGGDKCYLFTKPKPPKGRRPVQESESEDSDTPAVTDDICSLQKSVKEKAEAQGGAFIAFNRPTLCGKTEYAKAQCVQHGKIAIVDGERALISTGNFNNTSLCDLKENPTKCNRDYSYITRDPDAIKGLEEVFENDLKKDRYDLEKIVKDPVLEKKITVSPYSLEPLIAFVKTAKKSIQIQNQYMKDPDWNNAIKEVAKRGVAVTMQISNLRQYGNIKPGPMKKYCALFGDLKNSGVDVRVFTDKILINGKPGYLHAKAVVIDAEDPIEAKAWVGSVNGSTAALTLNREFGIFFNNPQRVKHFAKIIGDDFVSAESVSWEKQVTCE